MANYIAAYRNIQVIAAKAETPKDKKDLADKHWRQLEQLQLALNETKVCSFQRFPILVLHISSLRLGAVVMKKVEFGFIYLARNIPFPFLFR